MEFSRIYARTLKNVNTFENKQMMKRSRTPYNNYMIKTISSVNIVYATKHGPDYRNEARTMIEELPNPTRKISRNNLTFSATQL